MYIDKVEQNIAFSRPSKIIPVLGVIKFTILVYPSLEFITIPLVCLICVWK